MTKGAIKKFQKWVLCGYKVEKISGYLMLYPNAIKFINNPDNHIKGWCDEGKDLYISIDSAVLVGDSIKITSRFDTERLTIPLNYVKTIRIYNYNY